MRSVMRGRWAMSAGFWLSDRAWEAIAPLLPTNQPGARRVDDRRVISGIIHVLRIGCRWEDCPPDYGPATTIYNRFNRWSRRGLWGRIFATLAAQAELPDDLSIDSTAVRAHRSAHGGKGGENSGHRALAWGSNHQNPCPDRWLRARGCLHAQPRKPCRHLRSPRAPR